MRSVSTDTSLNNVHLLTSVDVVPLMNTADVVDNSGHCMYSIGLRCSISCLSLFQLVFHIYIHIYKCMQTDRHNENELEYFLNNLVNFTTIRHFQASPVDITRHANIVLVLAIILCRMSNDAN